MNKGEFTAYIAQENGITLVEAERIINIFTNSMIKAMGSGEEVSLLGFGNFTISKLAAREGRNPATGASVKISARNQPKFKPGLKLKAACNP